MKTYVWWRILTSAGLLLASVVGAVVVGAAPASAAPRANRVAANFAYIWNCPTGVTGCSSVQGRVGDIRRADPMTDVCRVDGNDMNLAYNRATSTPGGPERTGFLYRSNLQTPGQQGDSCRTGGVGASALSGTLQRLCAYTACGRTGAVTASSTIRTFCDRFISNHRWVLTTVFGSNGGPMTAGFIDVDDFDSVAGLLPDCDNPL
jgi:hypothetical protein